MAAQSANRHAGDAAARLGHLKFSVDEPKNSQTNKALQDLLNPPSGGTPKFVLQLQALPGIDATRALIKVARRRFGLGCIEVREDGGTQ